MKFESTKTKLGAIAALTALALVHSPLAQAQNLFPASGNAGVNTTSPVVALDVVGQLNRQLYSQTFSADCNRSLPALTYSNVLTSFTYTKASATSKLLIVFSGSIRANYTAPGIIGLLE